MTRDAWLLALLAAALFLPGLGNHDVWNPDESRYVEVAREMRAAGEQLVPRLNGGTYMQKPPLLFWSIEAAGALLGGIDETAARLPSALGAIGATLLVFAMGRALFSRRAGWLAAAAFATNAKVVWQARFGQIDMLLTFLVALAMWCWVRGRVDRDPRWYPFFFVAAGLATLAKGPVGLLPPLFGVLAFLAIERDREGLEALGLGRGLLVWAGIVLAWFLPASLLAGGGYGREVALRQTVVRYFSPWLHESAWYHYLTTIPGDFFPWSLLLPAAVAVGWRARRGPDREGWLLAGTWAVATVVFFSLSPAKRGVYILSMYPAMALAVGAALDRLAATAPCGRAWAWPVFLAISAVGAAAAVALPLVEWRFRGAESLPAGAWVDGAVAAGILAAGALAATVATLRNRPAVGAGVLAAAMGVASLWAALRVMPALDRITSLRPVAERLDRALPPGAGYAVYPHLEAGVVFYDPEHRRAVVLETPGEVEAWRAKPGPRYLLSRPSHAADLGIPLPEPVFAYGRPHVENGFSLYRFDGSGASASGPSSATER